MEDPLTLIFRVLHNHFMLQQPSEKFASTDNLSLEKPKFANIWSNPIKKLRKQLHYAPETLKM